MARRAYLLAPVAALLIGGCSYAAPQKLTASQETARMAFIKSHATFTDHELAQLCPALYPRAFLTDKKKYPLDKKDSNPKPTVTQADRTQATAAGCNVTQ